MGIYGRLMHIDDPPLPAHYVAAAINEFAFGRKSAAQIKTAFSLTASEGAELDTLLATITGGLAGKVQRTLEIHNLLMLGEGKVFYTTEAELKLALGV